MAEAQLPTPALLLAQQFSSCTTDIVENHWPKFLFHYGWQNKTLIGFFNTNWELNIHYFLLLQCHQAFDVLLELKISSPCSPLVPF